MSSGGYSGAEIVLYAFDRSRFGRPQEPCPELLAMGPVIDLFARGGDPFASRDHRRMTDDRDQVSMSAGLDPQNAESVLCVVECDALDEARQNFLG